MFVMGLFRKTSGAGRRPRAGRRVELSALGAERLEGRALLSHMAAHLTPAEIATIRAEHEAAHHVNHHVTNPGNTGGTHGHHHK
jgi:hypothetical protein